jgi:ATP-dependent 26S proteasome regulatory subunit
VHGFIPQPPQQLRVPSIRISSTVNGMDQAPVAIGIDPSQSPPPATTLQDLWDSAQNATATRGADTSNQGHDSFRYEWGTWVVDSHVDHLRERMNQVRVARVGNQNVYERLLSWPLLVPTTATTTDTLELDTTATSSTAPRRFRIAGGIDWDALLHVLPPNTHWQGRWPTGSWALLKPLTGLVEIAALSNDRNGHVTAKTAKRLRGGSDGSLGSGRSTKGEDCIKYVGGRLRRYTGTYGQTLLLEVVIRPPIGALSNAATSDAIVDYSSESSTPLQVGPDCNDILTIVSEEQDAVKNVATVSTVSPVAVAPLGSKLGLSFDAVGGLDAQLQSIVRRVLASRAHPAAARRLGVAHVRGILLSGPPGCGKTLLARELARLLGAREPQIVNGPEILDKYIGEAEKKVRELFAPAELEYQVAGDDSALHIIILDEMDAIARKRGTMTSDTTGVRDSVVNQLLAKMDGVKEASNVLVVGLTNRPELLDPALLRPGRLEVHLRIELPDLLGRRDILRIHTRQMRSAGGLSEKAIAILEDVEGILGIPVRTEHYSGAELAGLIRSAASFALGRSIESDENDDDSKLGVVNVDDLDQALQEVRPALGRQDEVLKLRFPLGISAYSSDMKRIMRDLDRFASPPSLRSNIPRLQSLLLVGAGGAGGAGATALTAWAASQASSNGSADYVRFVTALDVLAGSGGGGGAGDEARAAALVERFSEAKEMARSFLVLDDIDQLCAGSGPGGYSSVMIATLRALLRSPPSNTVMAGGPALTKVGANSKTVHILAATSRSDAACVILHELFDESIGTYVVVLAALCVGPKSNLLATVIPLLDEVASVATLYRECLYDAIDIASPDELAALVVGRLGRVGCKTALRLAERAVFAAGSSDGDAQRTAMASILDDLVGDTLTSSQLCEVL